MNFDRSGHSSPINTQDVLVKAPDEVLCDPALLFLFYRIEQILGIKVGTEALKNLNDYMEKTCGASFIENPAAYEYLLTSREQIFDIANILTINETYFFRESAHFKLLSNLLPELAELNRPLQICSAACSIGCEAYSIAMLFDYHANNGLNIDISIDAFDVNNEAIETAKNARYTANSIRNDGKDWHFLLDNYLIRDKNEYIVCDKIKRKVRFFPHNIMRGFEKKYDIIFFRNALIYFSSKNRYTVLNNICESLFLNGLLFLGTSETSSIKHPLLASRYSSDVFYYQKISNSNENPDFNIDYNQPVINTAGSKHPKPAHPSKTRELAVYCPDIQDILRTEEGKQNAEFVFEMINKNDADTLFGSQLAAAIIYYLQAQEFEKSSAILSYLEKHSTEACVKFLRGEYYYLIDNYEKAKEFYDEACCKDKYFWPAFYRIAVLSSEDDKIRYEYKIKKTIESIELSKNTEIGNEKHYECFMGGFSSGYFLKILEKKLS